jgi:hypothetical protein
VVCWPFFPLSNVYRLRPLSFVPCRCNTRRFSMGVYVWHPRRPTACRRSYHLINLHTSLSHQLHCIFPQIQIFTNTWKIEWHSTKSHLAFQGSNPQVLSRLLSSPPHLGLTKTLKYLFASPLSLSHPILLLLTAGPPPPPFPGCIPDRNYHLIMNISEFKKIWKVASSTCPGCCQTCQLKALFNRYFNWCITNKITSNMWNVSQIIFTFKLSHMFRRMFGILSVSVANRKNSVLCSVIRHHLFHTDTL